MDNRVGAEGSRVAALPLHRNPFQALQALTCPTMVQISLSRSPSSGESWRRVLVKAAQQNPLWVRTMMVEVPGRLPLCHQLLALLTAQPLA